MLRKKTVFILGAGASAPYKFPTADGLKKQIINESSSLLSSFNDAGNKIFVRYLDKKPIYYEDFIEGYNKAKTISIDLYLNINPHLADFGKMAIAVCLNKAELAYGNEGSNSIFKNVDMTDWLEYLFNNFIINGITNLEHLNDYEPNITFITFNYERSLEYFLWTTLSNHFSLLSYEDKFKLYKKFKIFHIYGDLGDYDDVIKGRNGANKLGGIDSLYVLNRISKNIKTIYERKEAQDNSNIKTELQTAKNIFFMGYGFGKENNAMLDFFRPKLDLKHIYSTNVDFSTNEIVRFNETMPGAYIQRTGISFAEKGTKCLNLIKEWLK
ncbi:MAG: hypothetical protein WC209_04840 [Ignavibacteriaceae bacterium]|jgi:hypothetical protein